MSQNVNHRVITAAKQFIRGPLWKLVFAYVLILAILAFLGRWTPDYLQGRDLWHFYLSRMAVPMVMLAALATFIRLVPAATLLASLLLFIGAISTVKRTANGEPFQVSDMFLAGQSTHLLSYVGWQQWLMAVPLIPAVLFASGSLRFRAWSLPAFVVCAGLLSSYRFEPVVNFIHDHLAPWGVNNLPFDQAESERMNGLATHLYFSTAGVRLKTHGIAEVAAALDNLGTMPLAADRLGPQPDIYIILGEAWWHDPSDPQSPIARLAANGFSEGTAISPVYGGNTPNAEFEVLTGIPVKSFPSGIIPYQHYATMISPNARTLPHLLEEKGYTATAFHNFTKRFWLRDQVYPRLGFQAFDSMDDMDLVTQPNGWPTDPGLYADVVKHIGDGGPQFKFIVTVSTHGPYTPDPKADLIGGIDHPGVADYRIRLSAAADALAKFDEALRNKGRPYVLLIFGDHLPGLRDHQRKIGMTADNDPRLHQVPFLVSGNTGETQDLRDRLDGKPLYCFGPSVADLLGLQVSDRYFAYVAKQCANPPPIALQPASPVIQNQIFTTAPL